MDRFLLSSSRLVHYSAEHGTSRLSGPDRYVSGPARTLFFYVRNRDLLCGDDYDLLDQSRADKRLPKGFL